MVWIDARWVVAAVKNVPAGWNLTHMGLKGGSVSQLHPAINADPTVAVLILCGSPIPAPTNRVVEGLCQ